MSTLRIKDLETSRTLGSKELSAIRGGDGARWVYGWMAAFNPLAGRAESAAVNFVQNNTIYMAEQMTNQFFFGRRQQHRRRRQHQRDANHHRHYAETVSASRIS
jgi:hypothetical protein